MGHAVTGQRIVLRRGTDTFGFVPSHRGTEGSLVPQKLWTRPYVLGLVVAFMVSLVLYLLMTSMALYASMEFGAGELMSGMAASIFVIGAVLARLWAGMAVDRLGPRRVLLVSLVGFLVAALAYLLVQDLTALLVVRLCHGVTFGAAHTATGAIVQSLIPAARRGEGSGYYGASTTLATAFGPLLAVVFLNSGHEVWLFITSSMVAAAALVAALFLRPPPSQHVPVETRRSPIEPTALPVGSVVLVCAVAYSGVIAFVNSYAAEIGLTRAAAAFFVVYAIVMMLLRPVMGRLQDVRGDNVVMYPSIVLCAAGFVALAASTGAGLLLLAAALLGAGWGTIISAGQAVVVSRGDMSRVGRSVATYFLMVDLGIGTGPIFLGWLLGHVDYRTMYLWLVVLVLLGAVLYHFVHGRHVRRRRVHRN